MNQRNDSTYSQDCQFDKHLDASTDLVEWLGSSGEGGSWKFRVASRI